jgi:hypothetical protein
MLLSVSSDLATALEPGLAVLFSGERRYVGLDACASFGKRRIRSLTPYAFPMHLIQSEIVPEKVDGIVSALRSGARRTAERFLMLLHGHRRMTSSQVRSI